MSEAYIGEIRMFAANFAPAGWALCDGQFLAISQNDALFSLFGTTYGGDGRTTFGLPDLRGRIPVHAGSGPGLTTRTWGQKQGSETATISESQLPVHTHSVEVTTVGAASVDPVGKLLGTANEPLYRESGGSLVNMAAGHIGNSAGFSQPHANLQPFRCINFIVALVGFYPSRS